MIDFMFNFPRAIDWYAYWPYQINFIFEEIFNEKLITPKMLKKKFPKYSQYGYQIIDLENLHVKIIFSELECYPCLKYC